ncbi:Modification methylase HaeIII [Streptomyces netropsis]|nr:Modification methylase HaeIII [Streptomyces netropsis]
MSPGRSTPLKVIDLFAGCGGFSAGFSSYTPGGALGPAFEPVAAVECDKSAAATYGLNHPAAEVFADEIAGFDASAFAEQADVITGGPPCQGFSGLGAQRPDDPRNELWRDYMRVVLKVRPRVFVLENVDRFLRAPEFQQLEDATSPGGLLQDYALTAVGILNAADYGVPQARRRAIVIGTRRDLPPVNHPQPTHSKITPAVQELLFDDALEPWVPVRSVFDRSARMGKVRKAPLPERKCAPHGAVVQGPFLTTELHFGRNPTALSLERYKMIPPGGNRWAFAGTPLSTPSWDRHRSGSGDVMGRLHSDRPSVTIRTEFYKPEKGRYLHPTEDRPITHYEAALIQGFPDDYKWCGTKIEIGKQIGNAVPIGLSRALAAQIHNCLTGEAVERLGA